MLIFLDRIEKRCPIQTGTNVCVKPKPEIASGQFQQTVQYYAMPRSHSRISRLTVDDKRVSSSGAKGIGFLKTVDGNTREHFIGGERGSN